MRKVVLNGCSVHLFGPNGVLCRYTHPNRHNKSRFRLHAGTPHNIEPPVTVSVQMRFADRFTLNYLLCGLVRVWAIVGGVCGPARLGEDLLVGKFQGEISRSLTGAHGPAHSAAESTD